MIQPNRSELLPSRQAAKLSYCGCNPSQFCSLHDTCFIYKSCLCEGSSWWPLVKPVHLAWVSESCEWLAALMTCRPLPLSNPYTLGQQVIIYCPYCPQLLLLRSHIDAAVGLSNAPCCKVFVQQFASYCVDLDVAL